MGAQIYFRHTPAGYQIIDMDLAERFSCPVCHEKNYNRECNVPCIISAIPNLKKAGEMW
jgi:hypothetical protein